MLSARKKKQMERRWLNVNEVIHAHGILALERHNIWAESVAEAKTRPKDVHAQHIFVETCLEKWPEWFEGVRL